MSPKPATISLLLLFLTLASLTLSSAATDNGCDGYDSVSALLEAYDLPVALFPNKVKNFSCKPPDKKFPVPLNLTIQLTDNCTWEIPGIIKIVVAFKSEISATISPRELSDIDGVRVTLSVPFVKHLYHKETLHLTLTRVKVFGYGIFESIQFFSAEGIASPRFPKFLFPSNPPPCDGSSAAALDYSGSARLASLAKNNQDAPMWVYKYGRLLPVVVAA